MTRYQSKTKLKNMKKIWQSKLKGKPKFRKNVTLKRKNLKSKLTKKAAIRRENDI